MLTFGIDFGTSNSAVAMASPDGAVRLASWSLPKSLVEGEGRDATAETLPSVLFAPNDERALYVGHEAIAKNLTTGHDGRFIQSIKAFLPQASFTGTILAGKRYSIEDLVAHILRELVASAERSLGVRCEGRIILGRPTYFSLDPAEDALAETRLRAAAKQAGLGEVSLVIEPVAAALAYEATLTRDETVLVVDLGGGTSDFTLMRVGPSQRGLSDRKASILASGGLPSAGDCFDGEIVRDRLFEPLGFGSSYRAMTHKTPVPEWIWRRLQRWNHVSFLKSKENLDFLYDVHESSDRAEAIDKLIQIVEEDLGYALFRAVERAKREVTTQAQTVIVDPRERLPLRERLTQKQFKKATAWLVSDIHQTALGVLKKAGVAPADVDTVFMTGGTSLLPDVRAPFAALFGEDRLRRQSMFTSVADGLARA